MIYHKALMMFNGGKPDTTRYDNALKRCEDRVAKNDDLCIHFDIETGWPTVITKAQNQALIDLLESCRPKPIDNPIDIRKILYFGTGGAVLKNNFEFWINPENPV
jgi:hypothetical protein